MTQPDFPLEVKTLIIHELSPYDSLFSPRYVSDSDEKKAAYFRDLRTVCLVWPDAIAIVRQIIFEKISIRPNDHHIDASLRNLCEALEHDPNVSTFVRLLEFSDRNPNRLVTRNAPFIPTASRPFFLSFLSFIPQMHKLEYLRLENMRFHQDTSFEFRDDLRILKESSVKHLDLSNSTFTIAAFNAFLGYWEDMEITLRIDGISLIPLTSDQMLLEIEEYTWDWDEEDTWTEWEVDKPRTASFLRVTSLDLKLSKLLGRGSLMLMDYLASHEWSPLSDVDDLQLFVGDSEAITATTVIRINNLIRRYNLSFLGLNFFTNQYKDAIGTPLYLGGVESSVMGFSIHKDFTLFKHDKDRFTWYVESLAAVPPDSRLRELNLELGLLVPLEVKTLGSQGVWGILDTVLSGENLQFETLTLDVFLKPSRNGARPPGLAQLQTWLMEVCFPEVAAKYFIGNKEETEGREASALRLWIGDEQVEPKKH